MSFHHLIGMQLTSAGMTGTLDQAAKPRLCLSLLKLSGTGDWNLVEKPAEEASEEASQEVSTPPQASTPPPLTLLSAVKQGKPSLGLSPS